MGTPEKYYIAVLVIYFLLIGAVTGEKMLVGLTT